MAKLSHFFVVALRARSELWRLFDNIIDIFGFRRRFYGSKRQDRWVVQRVFPEEDSSYFVEVGAGDGRTSSNTYVLERDYGWNGLVIEANPKFAEALHRNRNCECVLACVDFKNTKCEFFCFGHLGGIVSEDTDNSRSKRNSLLSCYPENILELNCRTLEQILDSSKAPLSIGFLSIDVEGAEYRVLKRFPFDRYSFESIVVERPTKEIHRLLTEAGYVLDQIFRNDGFYLSKRRASLVGAKPSSFDGIMRKDF